MMNIIEMDPKDHNNKFKRMFLSLTTSNNDENYIKIVIITSV